MLAQNVDLILRTKLSPADVVLDIGGWVQPFNRADYVLDILPYETRGVHGSIGPLPERFTKETWWVHDVCGGKPLPFRDKQIDFVICSHVLEDIRDPIHLCAEMIRIAKRGYVEVPSRAVEMVMGLEGRHYAGYYHHRWLIDIQGSKLVFRFKPHLLHESWRMHLPSVFAQKLSEEEQVSYLFWQETFEYEECIQVSRVAIEQELEAYVRHWRVYPRWRYLADAVRRAVAEPKLTLKRALSRNPRLKRAVERITGREMYLPQENPAWSRIPEIHSK